MSLQQQVTAAFHERFGAAPALVVRAPGRVNLIGEHTDYNDGFVLPMAINRAVWIALRPRDDGQVRLFSLDFARELAFDLSGFARSDEGPGEYVKGVAWALQGQGHILRGWEGVMLGDVPIGAGLSSSAALELAAARAFASVSGLAWDPAQMALLGQKAENGWVGVNCGIMDQMISAGGQAGHALLIDCRSLESELLPLPPGTAVLVLDTGTRRGLVDSEYNERRERCEAAAAFFGAGALRDVSMALFEARAAGMDPVTARRARHIISENERVLQAAAAMRAGDAPALGRLMDASHASLRDDFEVSSPALDAIVQAARAHLACYGARMTGAGFGGCAVALMQAGAAAAAAEQIAQAYRQATGQEPQLYICEPSDGAAVVAG